MSLLGVPHPQRKEVLEQHERGVAGFVRDSVEYVFRQLPVWTNYFWSVYVSGRYTESCCPEYLKPENSAALKAGLAERIQLQTCTVTELLKARDERISKFLLLDHMDWMSSYYPEALAEEWSYILMMASDARIVLHLLRGQPRRGSPRDRLEAFYGPQAPYYDAFRERLLHGRRELIERLDPPAGSRLVELGGRTGRNLLFFGDRLAGLRGGTWSICVRPCWRRHADAPPGCRTSAWWRPMQSPTAARSRPTACTSPIP